MRFALFHCIPTIIFSGCSHFAQLPATWESAIPSQADSCPSVDGTYLDKGELSNGSWNPSLIGWLCPKPSAGKKPDRVQLKLTGDTLQIRTLGATKNEEFLLSRQRGEFRCSGGFLQIPFSETLRREYVSAIGSGTLELSRTEHFLVVNRSHQSASLVIFVPVVVIGNNYGRFALVE